MNSHALDVSALRAAAAGIALAGFTSPGTGVDIRRAAVSKIDEAFGVGHQRTSLPKISKKRHA